jgi:hypothetical protein
MVQTRRSLSKSPKKENAPSESTTTPRSRRQQTRNALRSQSTGVGIVIDTKAKKIVFDEEGNAPSLLEAIHVAEPTVEPALLTTVDDNDDDDDNDAVEEVKGGDAKAQVQEQRLLERSTALESLLGQKRRRHKPKKEDELNDDFFAQLDAEMEQLNEEKKQKKDSPAPQGKLITFLAKDEVVQNKMPIQKEHNIQVVVLNDRPQIRSGPPLPFAGGSSSSYSRFDLSNGQDECSAKQLQKMKKTGRKAEPAWTRSNKVNQRLLMGKQIPHDKNGPSQSAKRTVVIRL